MRPSCSSNQIHTNCTRRSPSSKLTDGFISTLACPGGSEIALKWESNCQMETAHRYGWCASSKTIHLADNRTESHSKYASQRQKRWVYNCALMGLMKKWGLKQEFTTRSIVFVMCLRRVSRRLVRIKGFEGALCCQSWKQRVMLCRLCSCRISSSAAHLWENYVHLLTLLNILLSTLRTISRRLLLASH